MVLEWSNFNGSSMLHRADGLGAVYIIAPHRTELFNHEEITAWNIYAMNPWSSLCPINKDRAMLYRQVSTLDEAKAVAQEWDSGFIDALAVALGEVE